MIEINKPEGALRYKGCDSCGSHEDVIAIKISNKNHTSGRTICFCRDCAQLLLVGLSKVVTREVKLERKFQKEKLKR